MNAKDRRKARRSESRRREVFIGLPVTLTEQQRFLAARLLARSHERLTEQWIQPLRLYGPSLIFQILKYRPPMVAHFVRYRRMDVPLTRPIGMTALQILQDNSGVNDEVRGHNPTLEVDVAEEGDG